MLFHAHIVRVIYTHTHIYMIMLTWFTSDMSSNTHPVILLSDFDIEDALSSSTTIVLPVTLTPPLAPLNCYRNKAFLSSSPYIECRLVEYSDLNLNGPIRMLISRKIVYFLSFTSRALTTQVLPPPSATYFTIGRPIVCTLVLPLWCRGIARKRVVFHLLLSPSHLRDFTPIYDRPLKKQPLFDIPLPSTTRYTTL